jgi:hypothetical protein
VRFQGIVAGQYGGYAPLRPTAGAVEEQLLRDEANSLVIGHVQGQRQAGQSRTDYQYVEILRHAARSPLAEMSIIWTSDVRIGWFVWFY